MWPYETKRRSQMFHKHATNAFAIKERFVRGYRSCLERGHWAGMYKCHYLAGTSAYCAHWWWVLFVAQRRGGWHASVCLMDNKINIEWRMWWRERRRSEWLFSKGPHEHWREGETEVLMGRKINKQGHEKWSSFLENSISSFYSLDKRAFFGRWWNCILSNFETKLPLALETYHSFFV